MKQTHTKQIEEVIRKRFKDELGEELDEDDEEVIQNTKEFEEASERLLKFL